MRLLPRAAPADDAGQLRAELAEARAERDAYRAQLDGNIPKATAWLQTKVWRQRAALDALNRRVATQRFALCLYGQIREPVTPGEWRAARDAIPGDQARDRIEEHVPA